MADENVNVNDEQEPTKIDPQGPTQPDEQPDQQIDQQETLTITDEQPDQVRAEENAPPPTETVTEASGQAKSATGRFGARPWSVFKQRWVKFAGLGLAGLLVLGIGAGIGAEIVDGHFDRDHGDREYSMVEDRDHHHGDEYRDRADENRDHEDGHR